MSHIRRQQTKLVDLCKHQKPIVYVGHSIGVDDFFTETKIGLFLLVWVEKCEQVKLMLEFDIYDGGGSVEGVSRLGFGIDAK